MFGHRISRKKDTFFGKRTEAKTQPGGKTRREEEDEESFIAISNAEATCLSRDRSVFDRTDTGVVAKEDCLTAAPLYGKKSAPKFGERSCASRKKTNKNL